MTLAIAWVRQVADCQELLVASDSRLRGGYAWDCCPKITTLPRSDSVACFAGSTYEAYPLLLQMREAIGMHQKSRDRAMDIADMKGHTIRVFNQMREYIRDLPAGAPAPEPPEVVFLLAGYSWKRKRFHIWWILFDKHERRFTFRSPRKWHGVDGLKVIGFAGDYIREAKARLRAILRERDKLKAGGFDMEPFEVLRDMLRTPDHPLIGGPIQVAKVYEHMNCLPFGVYWPNRQHGGVTVLGRPLMEYEAVHLPILDPDTLESHNMFQRVG